MTDSEIITIACELMNRKFQIAESALKEWRPLNEEELKALDEVSRQLERLYEYQKEEK